MVKYFGTCAKDEDRGEPFENTAGTDEIRIG